MNSASFKYIDSFTALLLKEITIEVERLDFDIFSLHLVPGTTEIHKNLVWNENTNRVCTLIAKAQNSFW